MSTIKERFAKWILKNDNIYRIILWFANPIAYSTLPIVAVIMFMSDNKIFSYDFFTNGMFGLNTFFIFALFAILLLGGLLVGFLIPLISIIEEYYNENKSKGYLFKFGLFAIVFSLNLLLNIVLWNSVQEHEVHKLFLKLGFFIYLHIAISIYCPPKIKFMSLIIVISLLYFIMFINPSITSSFVKLGMQRFNINTTSNITIYNDSNTDVIISEGKLILLTPNKIFLANDHNISIIERNGKIIKFTKQKTVKKEDNK